VVYYYAYSGHKYGLDRVRRGAALIKSLKKEGIEIQLLVNDFRAGLAAKDLGVEGAVTIETILDVDAVAERGDSVILDTPEDASVRLEQYAEQFSPLFVVTDSCDASSRFGEILLRPFCKEEESCVETPMIDSDYCQLSKREDRNKEDRVLFIFGDADYDKEILLHRDFFDQLEMDLLLGYYFFVKYEDELSKIFHALYEPEEYADLLRGRSRILTASVQSALEAKAAGADVAYLRKSKESDCLMEQLAHHNINIIDDFDKDEVKAWLKMEKKDQKSTKIIDNISKQLSDLLNL